MQEIDLGKLVRLHECETLTTYRQLKTAIQEQPVKGALHGVVMSNKGDAARSGSILLL